MKSLFDTVFSFFLIILFSPLLILSLFIIWISDFNNPIFFAERVGINFKKFRMYKLRTMVINAEKTKVDSTSDDDPRITSLGKFFRKYKIDEIFQLINVLRGHMSFVGPRPALFNQFDLINLKTKKKIHLLIPGITGLAQINGRDLLSINEKVLYDYEYLIKRSFFFDIKIIIITIVKIFISKEITH